MKQKVVIIGHSFSSRLSLIRSVAQMGCEVTVASIVSAVVAYGVGELLHMSVFPDDIVKLAVCLIVYMAWSFIFKPEAYTYFLTITMPVLNKFKRKLRKH